ncbi:HdeD family acid-resistance protein [Undibacterium sp. SXout20W]|uniref:HdeD family acid-resistance protein n=1 Tax=Undibacterium sp. SXout20W TaxID=3413051 RepID=UPI003BF13C79
MEQIMFGLQDKIAGLLHRAWWTLLLRGILAIGFGFMVFNLPIISILSMVLWFGFYVLGDGVLSLWLAITSDKEGEEWWVLLLRAIVSIFIGVVTLITPGITELALYFYIAIWAISAGLMEISIAIRLRKVIEGEWVLILGGITLVALGSFLILRPILGVILVINLISAFYLLYGLTLIFLAIKARTFSHDS